MDYEKKYKEALEKARQLCNYPTTKPFISDLQNLFPELKESEDERIRRNIIAALKGEGYYDCDLTNECIAWLEKQGYIKKDVDDAYLKGICNTKHELEKQGDQKSVDKGYTFKSIPRLLDMIEPTDRAKSYCKKLIDSLQTEGYSVDAKIVGECLKQMNGEKVAMAVMDTEKQDEQKPAWSEEDEEHYKACLQYFDEVKPDMVYYKDYQWLKSLKQRMKGGKI